MAAYRRLGKWRYRRVIRTPDGKRFRISGTPPVNTRAHALLEERAHAERVLGGTGNVGMQNLYIRGGVFWIRYVAENGNLVRRSLGTRDQEEAARMRDDVIGDVIRRRYGICQAPDCLRMVNVEMSIVGLARVRLCDVHAHEMAPAFPPPWSTERVQDRPQPLPPSTPIGWCLRCSRPYNAARGRLVCADCRPLRDAARDLAGGDPEWLRVLMEVHDIRRHLRDEAAQ